MNNQSTIETETRGGSCAPVTGSAFFEIQQNNSGGSFNDPAVHVIIEAPSKDEACKRTSPHFSLCGDSGRYAEYDDCGCCLCCGHRWSEPRDDKPEDAAKLVEEIRKNGLKYMGATATALIKADGSIVIGDTAERLEAICGYITQNMSIPIQECPECGFVTPCKCEKRKNPTYGQLLAEAKFDEQTTPAPTPWSAKSEAYWHEQYQLMRERYWERTHENSKLAERIKDLTFLVTELQPNRDYADRIRELEDQLKAKQGESHELYAMLGHIVDWSPELPYYMKDEYKVLFKNALAAARELLSKCSVKEGK